MKVRFGAGVADARGSTAGITYSRNKGGSYQRARVTPTNPNTSAQAAQRSRISQLSQEWSNVLTQAERDDWAIFGVNFPTTDVFGEVIQLTGLQAFTRINSRIMAAGFAALTGPPADQAVTDLLTFSFTLDNGVGTSTAVFTPTPLAANDALQLFASPGLSPGISNAKNRLRLITTTGLAETTGYNFEADYIAKYGALPATGRKVFMEARVIRSTTGAVDARLVASTIVVST